MVSFYGQRKTSCFQARRQGHRLLRVDIHHLDPMPPSPPSFHQAPPSPTFLERDPSTSPSRSPACQPTLPNTFQGQKRKSNTTSKSTSPPKKSAKKITKKDPPKLPYETTEEENKKIVDAQVKAHFAKKKPPPKEKIAPEVVKKFVSNLQKPAKPAPASDYTRYLAKSVIKQKTKSMESVSGKQVPQLGEQKNQSPPLPPTQGV